MKTIGLLGGMSWESTLEYYRIINETVRAELGGLHSAKIVLYSVDFAKIEKLQHAGRWDDAGAVLADAARRLERAGADFIVLCTNTMHRLADFISSAVSIPLLHIADATAEQIREQGIRTVGLLGTKFTMEQDFYKGRLTEKFGLQVLIPDATDRETVHSVIYDELCLGVVREQSRQEFLRIMDELKEAGAEGIILGCTEIELLVAPENCALALFPTARIHAGQAARQALVGE